jgi:hypothetical protein
VVAAALSWFGLYLHNVADLPDQYLLSPETAYPSLVYLVGVAAWFTRPDPTRRVGAMLLLGWGWLQLVGGGMLSVLPLPIWPYHPEQTPHHYAFHLVYGATQLPLIVITTRHVRRRNDVRPAGSRRVLPPLRRRARRPHIDL